MTEGRTSAKNPDRPPGVVVLRMRTTACSSISLISDRSLMRADAITSLVRVTDPFEPSGRRPPHGSAVLAEHDEPRLLDVHREQVKRLRRPPVDGRLEDISVSSP